MNRATEHLQFVCLNLTVLLHSLYGTFPHDKAANSLTLQRFLHELVSADVIVKFLLPEVNSAFRHISVLASFVPMPVTAVNEDCDLVFGKIDIRMPEQTGIVLSVTKTVVIQQLAKVNLRFGVFTFD